VNKDLSITEGDAGDDFWGANARGANVPAPPGPTAPDHYKLFIAGRSSISSRWVGLFGNLVIFSGGFCGGLGLRGARIYCCAARNAIYRLRRLRCTPR